MKKPDPLHKSLRVFSAIFAAAATVAAAYPVELPYGAYSKPAAVLAGALATALAGISKAKEETEQ